MISAGNEKDIGFQWKISQLYWEMRGETRGNWRVMKPEIWKLENFGRDVVHWKMYRLIVNRLERRRLSEWKYTSHIVSYGFTVGRFSIIIAKEDNFDSFRGNLMFKLHWCKLEKLNQLFETGNLCTTSLFSVVRWISVERSFSSTVP